ncbi:MAG: glycosyltransferase family 2 protein [Phycisphaerales bacterium]|nr:glycosyltransferase family 2 protein [Phycisphaerales bacterium]
MTARIPMSVVAPAHNEEGNVEGLVNEVEATARALHAALPVRFAEGDPSTLFGVEFVLVDDGSTDRTRSIAQTMQTTRPWLRIVAMTQTPPGKGNGQSAAFHAGFRATRGELIAVLDADLQNDPKDLVPMMNLLIERDADMVQGDRSHARRDNWIRRNGSRVGRLFRRMILNDTIRDTGCSLRLMKREIALRLPLEFRGVHRFIPASARHMGYTVIEMQVNHRQRHAGDTKYGMGITQRAIPGLIDCFAVRWMRQRRRPVTSIEVHAPTHDAAPQVTVREHMQSQASTTP